MKGMAGDIMVPGIPCLLCAGTVPARYTHNPRKSHQQHSVASCFLKLSSETFAHGQL